MSKAPAFQFYPGDWRRDTQVQMLTMAARGVWFEMLCCMWDAPERGKLEGTKIQISRLLGCTVDELSAALQELSVTKTGDVTECNDLVTVINRRMYREERERKLTRSRVQKYRVTQKLESCNDDVTLPSSSSTSSSKKKESIKEKINFQENHFINIPNSLKTKWEQIAPAISIAVELTKAEAWVISNPKLKKSNWSRFLTNWMIRAQDHERRYGGNNGNGSSNRNTQGTYNNTDRAAISRASVHADADRDAEEANRIFREGLKAAHQARRDAGSHDAPDFADSQS